jgi:hypothetical protein
LSGLTLQQPWSSISSLLTPILSHDKIMPELQR